MGNFVCAYFLSALVLLAEIRNHCQSTQAGPCIVSKSCHVLVSPSHRFLYDCSPL